MCSTILKDSPRKASFLDHHHECTGPPIYGRPAVRSAMDYGRLGFWRGGLACVVIVVVAGSLRFFELGRLSFWYDEVVTMRLATAAGPGALVERLFEIDATRAPLHPLLLQTWIRVFGSSEAAARSLSVLCGLATIVLIYEIGRIAFDTETGVWASWLAAFSPLLIVYAREARMYGWLVFATCLCWRMLFGLAKSTRHLAGWPIWLA